MAVQVGMAGKVERREGRFVRGLGLLDATSLVAGSMIGSGIFIVSADIARATGAPGWLLVVWVATGVLTVAGALAYGELAALMPQAGGQYVYLREAYGPLTGFLYGWTLFLVIQTGSIAAVGVAFAKFAGVLVPWISPGNRLIDAGALEIAGRAIPIGLTSEQLVGVAVIALLTASNSFGLGPAKLVQNAFTALKIAALLGLVGLGLFAPLPQGGGALAAGAFFDGALHGGPATAGAILSGLAVAMVGGLFAADAWNNVTFAGAEVRRPERTIPLSMAIGATLVIGLYLLANLSYLRVLTFPAIQGAPADRVATASVEAVLGPSGAAIMAAAIMISTFGCLNGMILAGPRLTWAMAKDGVFFSMAGELGLKSGVPVKGLAIQGVWSALLVFSGTYSDLLDYVIFAALLFYFLTVIGIFVLRARWPGAPRPYRVPAYPVLPLLYVAAAGAIMLVLLWKKPVYTWPGLVIVVAGVPVYFVWRAVSRRARRAASEPAARAGH